MTSELSYLSLEKVWTTVADAHYQIFMLINAEDTLMEPTHPVPNNEMDRVLTLSGFDIDYSDHQNNFQDLAKLAAKVAGTSISLVNMIDSLTQWTISNYGLEVEQMLREESVCQYTIMQDEFFEVADLSIDDRFKNKAYVLEDPNARYYYGIPLTVGNGLNIGALCVLDQKKKVLDPEKIELLKIIASEIVNRLKTFKVMEGLKSKLMEAQQAQKKVAHDIRGPLGGIIGLASIIRDQGETSTMEEVLEFMNLIYKSGNSVLDLADEILGSQKPVPKTIEGNSIANPISLQVFKEKLEKLYQPQATSKKIQFEVRIAPEAASAFFSKNKLLQIAGNLISNSMKFTPSFGTVSVDLSLTVIDDSKTLTIVVTDSGVGLSEKAIQSILTGSASSTEGTTGEQGYGFGLALVKHLVETLHGSLNICSKVGNGAVFTIVLPQN